MSRKRAGARNIFGRGDARHHPGGRRLRRVVRTLQLIVNRATRSLLFQRRRVRVLGGELVEHAEASRRRRRPGGQAGARGGVRVADVIVPRRVLSKTAVVGARGAQTGDLRVGEDDVVVVVGGVGVRAGGSGRRASRARRALQKSLSRAARSRWRCSVLRSTSLAGV